MIRNDLYVVLGAVLLVAWVAVPILYWSSRLGVLAATVVAMLSRLAFGLGGYWISGLDASDAQQYHDFAMKLAQGYDVGGFATGKESWPILLSYIYRVFGEAPELGLILNSIAAGAAVPVVYAACKRLGWAEAAAPTGWIIALWPVGVFWSGLLVREAIVILLLAVALWGAAFVRTGSMVVGIGLLVATGGLLMGFRGGLAMIPLVVLPAALAIVAIVGSGMTFTRRLAATLFVIVLIAIAIPALADLFNEAKYLDWTAGSRITMGNNAGTTAIANAGGEIGSFSGIPRGLANLPLTAFGPMVWNWTNYGLILSGLDGIVWLVMAILSFIGVRHMRGRADSLLCSIPLVMLLVYLGIGLANYGLMMRIRGIGIPFLAPLAALGVAHLIQKRREAPETRSSASPSAAPEQPGSIGARQEVGAHHV